MFVCCDPGAEETDVDEAIISKSNKYMFRNSEDRKLHQCEMSDCFT